LAPQTCTHRWSIGSKTADPDPFVAGQDLRDPHHQDFWKPIDAERPSAVAGALAQRHADSKTPPKSLKQVLMRAHESS
jgi:hypothetical protein